MSGSLGVLLASAMTIGAIPGGKPFLISAMADRPDSDAVAVGDGSGGVFVVWAREGPAPRIVGRRYDSSGAAGEELEISTSVDTSPAHPAISCIGSGMCVVVWQTGGGSTRCMRGRRFAPGSAEGDEPFEVFCGPDARAPAVAVTADDGWTVVWQAYSKPTHHDIYGRTYETNGDGGPIFRVNVFVGGPGSFQERPKIASAPAGGFWVCWESFDQEGDERFGVRCRVYDENGDGGDEFHVNQYTAFDQQAIALAVSLQGRVLVAFESCCQTGAFAIVGRFYDQGGVADGDEFLVSPGHGRIPAATALPSEEFVAVWWDYGRILGRRFSSPQMEEAAFTVIDSGFPFTPSVAAAACGFLVTWVDDAPANSLIWGRRYTQFPFCS